TVGPPWSTTQSSMPSVSTKARHPCSLMRRGYPGPARSGLAGVCAFSVELANHADELALDPHVVVELRLVGRVRGLEADAVLLSEEALEGDGVLLDLGNHDVAIASRRLRPDEHEV